MYVTVRQLSASFTNGFLGKERLEEGIRKIEGKPFKKKKREKHISATEVSKLECRGRDRTTTERQHKGSQSRKSGSVYQIEVEGSRC